MTLSVIKVDPSGNDAYSGCGPSTPVTGTCGTKASSGVVRLSNPVGVEFNSTDEYASASDTGLPSGSAAMSISWWFKISGTIADYRVLWAWGTTGGTNSSIACVMDPSDNKFAIATWGDAGPFSGVINDGAWHHAVAIHDGANSWALYIDGSLVDTQTAVTNISLGGGLTLNRHTAPASAYYAGVTLDDFRIYDIALTGTDVTNIYNSGNGTNLDPVSGSHLVRWYKMNEGSGSTLTDSGTNGTNATLQNTPTWVSGITGGDTPDLSGVAANDIIHVDSSSGRRFARITSVSTTEYTVTCAEVFANTEGGRTFGIGGKLASIGSTSSRKLFDQGDAAGDIMPGWIVQPQDGYTETITSTIKWWRTDQGGVGSMIGANYIESVPNPAVRPIFTFTNNGPAFVGRGDWKGIRGIDIINTNATKTASIAFSNEFSSNFHIDDVRIGDSTNKFWRGIQTYTGGYGYFLIENSEIKYCASHGIYDQAETTVDIRYCQIHHNGGWGYGSAGSRGDTARLFIHGCTFDSNTSGGVQDQRAWNGNKLRGLRLTQSTFYNNGGPDIELAATATAWASIEALLIENCIFHGNSTATYGIRFTSGTITAGILAAVFARIRNNCFYGHATAKYTPADIGSTGEQTVDPQFADASNRDFRIGTALKATGYPTGPIAGNPYALSSVDPGDLQRQEAGGGYPRGRHVNAGA